MFIIQRAIDWSRGVRDLSRSTISAEARRAHIRASGWAQLAETSARKVGTTLVIAGRYDRAAIMRTALATAAARRRVTGDAWALCLADALRGVWKVARAQRALTRH